MDGNQAMAAVKKHGICLTVQMGYWRAHSRNENNELVCSKPYWGRPIDAIAECAELLDRNEVTA